MSEHPAPARPRLAEALACVTGVPVAELIDGYRYGGACRAETREAWNDGLAAWALARVGLPRKLTAPEAWEALCTALDLAGWVEHPRRAFADPVAGDVEFTVRDDVLRGDRIVTARLRRASGYRYQIERGYTPELREAFAGDYEAWQRREREGMATQLRDRARRDEPRRLPHPATVADCVAFAADAANVLAAEAIVRAVVGDAPPRIVWRVLPRGEMDYRIRPADLSGRGPVVGAQRDVAVGRCVADPPGMIRVLYDATADLLATGYALDDVTADAVALLAPGLAPGLA